MFRKHHYLNHSINNASRCFVATLNGQLCAFTSILPFPHPIKKNFYKAHRTVVLPDYQGIGISVHLTHFICELLEKEGKGYITTTSNPARIQSLKKDKNFICTRIGRASSGSGKIQNKFIKNSTSCNRITVSFEYVSNKKPIVNS